MESNSIGELESSGALNDNVDHRLDILKERKKEHSHNVREWHFLYRHMDDRWSHLSGTAENTILPFRPGTYLYVRGLAT